MSSGRPQGLLGVRPDWDAGIGVHVGVGRKGPTGAPIMKDRFFLGSVDAHSADTSGPNKLRRDHLPAFAAWNERSERAGEVKPGGPLPETVTLRGVIAHARLADCLRWNRAAQKALNGERSPISGRPWCQGNGIEAVRIATDKEGEETETSIPCPNEECPVAILKACKPRAEMLFMLRWDGGPAWQAGLPQLLALYVHHSWNTLRAQLGLFELVLGTGAVMPWEPEDTWKPGLAHEMGITNPSLVGLPFAMTVGEKTRPARNGEPGRRFPVVHFSAEGDLGNWLAAQLQRRGYFLAAGAAPRALPPSLQDPDLQPMLDVAHVEIEPAIDTAELTGLNLASAPRSDDRTEGAAGGPGEDGSAQGGGLPLDGAPPEGVPDEPEPEPPPLMTRRDVATLKAEAQRAGLPIEAIQEVLDSLTGRYGAGNVPAWEIAVTRTKLEERAAALRSRSKR